MPLCSALGRASAWPLASTPRKTSGRSVAGSISSRTRHRARPLEERSSPGSGKPCSRATAALGVSASPGSWKGHQIESALSGFQAANPGAPASAYFKTLGMICKAPPTPWPDNVRCEIELPIIIRCSTVFLPFGGPPMPRELEGQISATLWTSVALPSSGDLKVSTRILPVPGGRLCQR